MQAIDIQNQPDQYVIRIPKAAFTKDAMLEMLQTLQLEQLAQKVDFEDSVLELAEEINVGWWQTNKERFIGKKV